LSGAAAGAAVGGLTGALVGLGIPEIEAKRYEGKVKGGNILLSVHVRTSDQQKRAETILKQAGAQDVVSTSEASVPSKAQRQQAGALSRLPASRRPPWHWPGGGRAVLESDAVFDGEAPDDVE